MALDAAKGMLYLHMCQPPILHRDLKSANLLVSKHWKVKVPHAGIARPCRHCTSRLADSFGMPSIAAASEMEPFAKYVKAARL